MAQTRTARTKTRSIVSSRDRIRKAAKRLFAERGYEGTSTAEICSLADTSQSQLAAVAKLKSMPSDAPSRDFEKNVGGETAEAVPVGKARLNLNAVQASLRRPPARR